MFWRIEGRMAMIDWENFTPWTALTGGILIGLASALFVLINGRIAGISGIIAGLLQPKKGDLDWRLLFVAGMLTAPLLYRLIVGIPLIQVQAGWITLCLRRVTGRRGNTLWFGLYRGRRCGLSRLSLPPSWQPLPSWRVFVMVKHLSPGWAHHAPASWPAWGCVSRLNATSLGSGAFLIQLRWMTIALVFMGVTIVGVYAISRISNGF
jgi:hypothetical protein